jgi:hypothetical protein
MRNLTHPETAVVLLLIAVASLAAYQQWFAPALDQIARDRRETQRILYALVEARRSVQPSDVAATDPVSTLSTHVPLSIPLQQASEPAHAPLAKHRQPRASTRPNTRLRSRAGVLDEACQDSDDPLCGALDR